MYCIKCGSEISFFYSYIHCFTNIRRTIQEKYNKDNNIVPKTIIKEIKEVISTKIKDDKKTTDKYSKKEIKDMIVKIEHEMREAASNLDFERATELRDIMFELSSSIDKSN